MRKISGVADLPADPAGQAEALRRLYEDPIDYPMYRHARRRFEADLEKYRVGKPLCAMLECLSTGLEAYFDAPRPPPPPPPAVPPSPAPSPPPAPSFEIIG